MQTLLQGFGRREPGAKKGRGAKKLHLEGEGFPGTRIQTVDIHYTLLEVQIFFFLVIILEIWTTSQENHQQGGGMASRGRFPDLLGVVGVDEVAAEDAYEVSQSVLQHLSVHHTDSFHTHGEALLPD